MTIEQGSQPEDEQPALPVVRCKACGRPLTDFLSRALQMGPVCRSRVGPQAAPAERARPKPQRPPFDEVDELALADEKLLMPPLPEADALVVTRTRGGVLKTNVPRIVAHHSPGGFEIGYGGSGPADLALNLLEVLVRGGRYEDTLPASAGRAWDGSMVSGLAWRLHQPVKWQFIATMRQGGGKIRLSKIDRFVGAALTVLSEAGVT